MSKKCVLIATALLGLACSDKATEARPIPTQSQTKPAATPGAEKCSFSAWGSGAIRATPDSTAPVIGTLPEMQFTITNIQNGLFRYTSASPVIEDILSAEERTAIANAPTSAWVETVGLGTATTENHFRLYEQAEHSSKRLIDQSGPGVMPFSDGGNIKSILDCKGTWVKVSMHNGEEDGVDVTGWLSEEHQCNNPLTSC